MEIVAAAVLFHVLYLIILSSLLQEDGVADPIRKDLSQDRFFLNNNCQSGGRTPQIERRRQQVTYSKKEREENT